ncbi:MAG: hypothetical protein IJ593_05250 [Lachnospiraceae bacterium]|nr:hypothetical protein [Lachnospiraceae bacterium]
MNPDKIIIKTGETSKTRVTSTKPYRAITVDELSYLINSTENSIIIIENIYSDEYDRMVELLRNYVNSENHLVFFYVPDNNDTTTGLADELEFDICMTFDELKTAVINKCGLDINPGIVQKNDTQNNDEINIEELFGKIENDDIIVQDNTDNNEVFDSTIYESVIIHNKVDAGIMTLSDTELGIEDDTQEKSDNTETVETNDTNEVESIENNDSTEENEDVDKVETSSVDSKELQELRDNLADIQKKLDDAENYKVEIEKKYSKSVDKIAELNKVIESLRDSLKDVQGELSRLENSDIIQDPAANSAYETLKKAYAELEEKFNETAGLSNEEATKLKDEIEQLKLVNDELENKLTELQLNNDTLNARLTKALDDTSKDDRIKELQNSLLESEASKNVVMADVDRLKSEASNNESKIKSLSDKLNEKIDEADNLSSLLSTAANKLLNADSLRNELDNQIARFNSLNRSYNMLYEENESIKEKLRNTEAETEHRIELAQNFAREDLENTRSENTRLKAELSVTKSMLEQKSAQYESMVMVYGGNADDALSLVDEKRALEETIKTLRSQLGEANKTIDHQNNTIANSKNLIDELSEKNKAISKNLKVMSNNSSWGDNSNVIPKMTYNGKAPVLAVTGSGSYGISVTAYSLAKMLSAKSRVIIIDFDLVYAKLDAYARHTPLIDLMGGGKTTGIEYLINNGPEEFIRDASGLIIDINPNSNKGFLGYISGILNKPDFVRFVSCNYSLFFNYLGNTYDYIVIDCGKLGTSSLSNNMIRNIVDISYGTLFVTTGSTAECRNSRAIINSLRLDNSKITWLLNLVTKINAQKVEEKISPSNYGTMHLIDDFYGTNNNFLDEGQSRSRFEKFINKQVFNRG